ncbi:MAG: hypothetical protein K8F90_15480, partial [Hyphomicrobiales bacterium]|nr:hypothetical protein [Hyphomicrobiales bacterium]
MIAIIVVYLSYHYLAEKEFASQRPMAKGCGAQGSHQGIHPPTDYYGAARQLMAAAFRFWRKEGGGDVPALASSLHMLVESVVWVVRLKAR